MGREEVMADGLEYGLHGLILMSFNSISYPVRLKYGT